MPPYFTFKSHEGRVLWLSGGLVTKVSVPSEALMVKAAIDRDPWFATYRKPLVGSTVRNTGCEASMTPEPAVANGDPATAVNTPELTLNAETSLEPELAEYSRVPVESTAITTGCVPAGNGEPAT